MKYDAPRNPAGHPPTLVPAPVGNTRALRHGLYSEDGRALAPLRPRSPTWQTIVPLKPRRSPFDASPSGLHALITCEDAEGARAFLDRARPRHQAGSMPATLSVGRRKFWGWGLEGEGLGRSELEQLGATFADRFGIEGVRIQEPPRVE